MDSKRSVEIVTKRAVTYVNNSTPATITTKEIDLNSCYSENEIVIEIYAAALNPVDLLTHAYASPLFAGSSLKTLSRDYCGVIVRRGDSVNPKWKEGDEVNGWYEHLFGEEGSLSTYLVLDPGKQTAIAHIEKSPASQYDEFTFNAAWPLVFGTAYSVLYNYGQKFGPESKILVIGASTSVSYALLQIAKHVLHVGTVVGICNSKSIEYNKAKGYDYLAAYDEGPMIESVGKVLVGNLNNEKFDLIFDSVGNRDFFPVMDKFLKPKSENSHYVTIVGDGKILYKSPSMLQAMSLGMVTRTFNPFRTFNYSLLLLKPNEECMKLGAKLVAEGRYSPVIDTVYPFDEYRDAIEKLRSNRAKGKLVIKVKES